MTGILIKLYFFIKVATVSCAPDVAEGFERARRYYKVDGVSRIDERIDESSGLIYLSDSTLLSQNDSGGEPTVYRINLQGEVIDSIRLDIPNYDWESLAYDYESETLYIADTGNNRNNRKKLGVYAYHVPSKKLTHHPLRYADQEEFPPPEEKRDFDCEAIVFRKGEIVMFSKNRGESDATKQYVLPMTHAGEEVALEPLYEQYLHKQQVTGASISPSGNRLALLTYGRIYLFKLEKGQKNLLAAPWRVIKCNRMGQSEGVCFLSEETLLFSNENRKLFKVYLNRRGRKQLAKEQAKASQNLKDPVSPPAP